VDVERYVHLVLDKHQWGTLVNIKSEELLKCQNHYQLHNKVACCC